MFSLLHIARGLDWHSQRNIIETFLVKVTCAGDIDCFPNYEIGYTVEVFILEFLNSFYISSQMLDKGYVYPQKFPGVLHRLATQQLAVFFFRLVPETLSRFFRQTTEKHHVF